VACGWAEGREAAIRRWQDIAGAVTRAMPRAIALAVTRGDFRQPWVGGLLGGMIRMTVHDASLVLEWQRLRNVRVGHGDRDGLSASREKAPAFLFCYYDLAQDFIARQEYKRARGEVVERCRKHALMGRICSHLE
jgi:hypothetical protein